MRILPVPDGHGGFSDLINIDKIEVVELAASHCDPHRIYVMVNGEKLFYFTDKEKDVVRERYELLRKWLTIPFPKNEDEWLTGQDNDDILLYNDFALYLDSLKT
ncbi:MAG: hypothetical protein FWG65_02430 [Turicibacter sp.]|nr:hypothetical protein [Turicibacter sp.]